MIYLDGMAGYWLRRDNDPSAAEWHRAVWRTAREPVVEHFGPLPTVVGNMSGNNISILDMTIGADFQFGPLTTVTAAYCTPLTSQREFRRPIPLHDQPAVLAHV